MLRQVLLRMTILTSTSFSALALGPGLVYGHGHNLNHCGSDINEFASAVTHFLGPQPAGADSFKKEREAPLCGRPDDKTTFRNDTDFPARHRFKTSHSKTTEYSAKMGAGFKGAFETEMGYRSDSTATEEYDTEVEVPPHRAAKLMVSPSLWYVEGTWRHGWLGRDETYTETYRPTGHMLWMLRDVTDGE